jgi:hypothetical protein
MTHALKRMTRRALASAAVIGMLASPGAALAGSTTHPDYTDLWWNESESGWGVQVNLQADVIFLTLFVYGDDGKPVFFVASDLRVPPAAAPGETFFTGTLYRTTGPAFSGAFDPAAVGVRSVGSATLRFTSPAAGTFTYSVDGATVTKAITRQTWQDASLAGEYRGGLFAAASNCTAGAGENSISYPGSFTVTRTGNTVAISSRFSPGFASGGVCQLNGTWSQQGRLGAIAGSYHCEFLEEGPTPVSGTFEITAIEFGEHGWSGRYTGHEGASCLHFGRYGGVRRGYPDLPNVPVPEPEPGPED